MKRFALFLLILLLVSCNTTSTETPSPIETPIPSPLETPPPDAQSRARGGDPAKPLDQNLEEPPMSIANLLTVAAFLSLIANRLVEALATPIFTKYKWDKLALMYIAWLFGGMLTVFSGINLFADIPGITMHPTVGLILSGLVAGGGANLLHELFGALGQGKARTRSFSPVAGMTDATRMLARIFGQRGFAAYVCLNGVSSVPGFEGLSATQIKLFDVCLGDSRMFAAIVDVFTILEDLKAEGKLGSTKPWYDDYDASAI